jgi:hypothetical protein
MRSAIYQTLNTRQYIFDTLGRLPIAAYSLRRLTRRYRGYAIKVRRSLDNALLNIGFNGSGLDIATLTAFCGSGNGFIQTQYDHIGERHLVQDTFANQPMLVKNGAVVTINGLPSIEYTQPSSLLAPPPMANLDELDIVLVHREDTRQDTILFDLTGDATVRGIGILPWVYRAITGVNCIRSTLNTCYSIATYYQYSQLLQDLMPTKIDWIKSQVLALESASDLTSRLNTATTIDNPTPQPQILTPITLPAIRKAVDKAEAFKVQETETWDDLVSAIAVNDRQAVRDLVGILVGGGVLSTATAIRLSGIFTATIPDPTWKARIVATPTSLAGFDPVFVHEAQEAIDAKTT